MKVHLYADVREITKGFFSFRFILKVGKHQKEETGIIPSENEWRAINYVLEIAIKSLKKPVPIVIHTNIPDEGYYFYIKEEDFYKSLPSVEWINENPYLAFKEVILALNEFLDKGDFYEIIEPAA